LLDRLDAPKTIGSETVLTNQGYHNTMRPDFYKIINVCRSSVENEEEEYSETTSAVLHYNFVDWKKSLIEVV
jgi:hypothetical protein